MFKRILHPTDFSVANCKAIDFINDMKNSGTEEIVLLHVIDSRLMSGLPYFDASLVIDLDAMRERLLKSAKDKLRPLVDDFTKAGFRVFERIEEGIPFVEILKVEREEQVEGVVICSCGLSNVKEVFIGSVAAKIIRNSVKPVLVVK